jgi:hypothetical protein
MGTLHFPDARFITNAVAGQWQDVRVSAPGFSGWSPPALDLTGDRVGFGTNGFRLDVPGALTVGPGGGLVVYPHDEVSCASLLIDEGGSLTAYSGPCAMDGSACGALVDVRGAFTVASNAWVYPWSHMTQGGSAWVYPWSHMTQGGSALFRAGSLTVAAGGGFDADARGYRGGHGQGAGLGPGGAPTPSYAWGGGGGYGGAGGAGESGPGGGTYGAPDAPVWPGSGGGSGWGTRAGNGGGAVRISAVGRVLIDGTISANGDNALEHGGGGSGGSIYVDCGVLAGSTSAVVRANGGTGWSPAANRYGGGGGGGGRIAFYYDFHRSKEKWVPAVAGGLGYNDVYGEHGTVYRFERRPAASILIVQ